MRVHRAHRHLQIVANIASWNRPAAVNQTFDLPVVARRFFGRAIEHPEKHPERYAYLLAVFEDPIRDGDYVCAMPGHRG